MTLLGIEIKYILGGACILGAVIMFVLAYRTEEAP